MSTAVMPTQLDIGETAYQSRGMSSSRGLYCMDQQQWQMCSTTTTTFLLSSRQRNLSGPVTSSTSATLDNRALATPPPGVPGSRDSLREKDFSSSGSHNNNNANRREGSSRNNSHHRKLDRSLSDSEDRINGNNNGGGSGRGVNSSRYKTELCRPFEESGHCKYGDKCQFAHGAHELRNLSRHPKYKTELCRTYHSVGFCPYGPRCHFIHNEDEHKASLRKYSQSSSNGSSSPRMSSSSGHHRQCQMILSPSSSTSSSSTAPSSSYSQHRPSNLCGLNSLGSSFESVSSSSGSPGNLSPSHLEDTFPPIGTFSPSAIEDSATPVRGGNSSEMGGTVFNFPASDTSTIGSVLTPLNIQTQQMYNNANVLDVAAIARFSAVLNLNQNQQNNQQTSSYQQQQNLNARQQPQPTTTAAEKCCWSSMSSGHRGEAVPESGLSFPPSLWLPRNSNSDDSMGSNGSLELISSTAPPSVPASTTTNLVNSPHELGRAMRLPIFNKLAVERNQ
uniref:Tis11-like protein n=1 Tax=Tritia obsoleta TaxID=1934733 RepID=A8CKA5_9CAEN|nr:Tis11-like protein [Tritia obsoleta]